MLESWIWLGLLYSVYVGEVNHFGLGRDAIPGNEARRGVVALLLVLKLRGIILNQCLLVVFTDQGTKT